MSGIEGLAWGLAPLALVSGNYPAELVCLIVTLSVASGATVVFGAYRPAFLALFVPATAPYAIQSAASHDVLQHATTLLILIYMAAVAAIGLSANKSFQRLVELRLEAETFARAAEAANLAKSSFLAAASHDLRQPVHALGLFVGALRGCSMSPDALGILERIESSAEALDGLFSALLDISRLDAGIVDVNVVPFPIAPMLERICLDHASEARDKGIELILAHGRATLQSDPILVERILRNLVSNAVRHTHEGRVLVGYRRDGPGIRVEVWDTGPGIPVDQHDKIFQEFVQLGTPNGAGRMASAWALPSCSD